MSRAITREEEGPMTDQKKVQEQGTQKISRRNVLKAAMAAGGAAALGFPNIVKAQGVTTMRWQSTWPSKDIFHEYALDYAKKVNDMTGGDLKIEVLPAGAVVPAFGLLDAVSKGTLDGGQVVPALDRGLIDAAEFNNASSDRALGFQDVSKVCMLQSYHQNAEQFEIMFNKTKYDALPDKVKAIIAYSVEAASQDMSWKAIDRYSKDYIELQAKEKVRFYRTPDSVLQKQLEVFDQVEAKYSAQNPLFKEIAESQKKFAERAVKWDLDTVVPRRMAYNHYFAKKPAAKPAAQAAKPEAPDAKKN